MRKTDPNKPTLLQTAKQQVLPPDGLWYRRLPVRETKEEVEVMDLVLERFLELGGFTREISKSIGW